MAGGHGVQHVVVPMEKEEVKEDLGVGESNEESVEGNEPGIPAEAVHVAAEDNGVEVKPADVTDKEGKEMVPDQELPEGTTDVTHDVTDSPPQAQQSQHTEEIPTTQAEE